MDTAFQSRIQIGIAFRNMTAAVRAEVWEQLLLLNNRAAILDMKLDEIKKLLCNFDLNGRQIRNALNVAEGLAFDEFRQPGMLKFKHIKEAVHAAVEFQTLLQEAKSSMKTEQTVWAPYRSTDTDFSYM
jgi:hypothetical protein